MRHSLLLTTSSITTVGSVKVPSLVAVNGCQVSLLGGFHPNSSFETAKGLLPSQQAGALPVQTAPGTEGAMWQKGRGATGGHHFPGFTPTHTTHWISQLGLHLTLDMQPTKQTSMEGWERAWGAGGRQRAREWMLELREWQTTSW